MGRYILVCNLLLINIVFSSNLGFANCWTINCKIAPLILIQTGSSITEAEHQPISSSPNSGNKAGSTPPQANTPPPSLNSSFNIGNTNTPNRNLLGLTPSDEVVFDVNNAGENNGLQAKLQIKNNSNKMVVFKVNKQTNSMWKANKHFETLI